MTSKKKKTVISGYENVRVSVEVMSMVRAYCEENKVRLGGFFELAAKQRLDGFKSQNTVK